MQRLFIASAVLILVLISCKKNDLKPYTPPVTPPIVAVDLIVPADSIKLDPYGYAPLSALVNFSSAVAGRAVIIVKGKHGAPTDIEHVFIDSGLYHSIPVIGLYGDYLNTVYLRLINNNGDTVAKATLSIQTGSLPADLPTSIEADIFPSEHAEKGINLVSNFSAYYPHIPLMVDCYADIRWLLNFANHPDLKGLNYDTGIKRLRNGNFFFGDITTDQVYEVDLLGQVVHSWNLKQDGFSFHHDISEKPDGNFLITVSKEGSKNTNGRNTVEDFVVEMDRQTGSIKTVWDLKKSLDEYRTCLSGDPYDWMHLNSVLYDSSDNTIIVSGRVQGVVKLNFENEVKWIIATHKDWKTNRRGVNLNKFLLTPLTANGTRIKDTSVLNGDTNHPDFEWPWFQHSTIALPNGDLMVFDNGTYRNYDFSSPRYSRAVEYKIDTANMTIQQVWQYGKERGLETFSSIISSVQYLPETNHILFCPGYQVTNYQGIGGKIVEIDYNTKQVVSQISLSTANHIAFHRAKRMSAYPE